MVYAILKNKKGQGIMEAMVIMILTVFLLGGVMQIWLWSNRQIVMRQVRYNATRLIAGKTSNSNPLRWPVYNPGNLTEESVFVNQ